MQLNDVINRYCLNKSELDSYKKLVDEDSKYIKSQLNNESFDTGEYVATVKTIVTEDFDESKLITKLKEMDSELISQLIKTKEYVDMELLESAIYEGLIDPTQLKDCKISKSQTRLTVKRSKSNS